MAPKHMYEIFKQEFPWFVPNVVKFSQNRKDGGIDIYLDNQVILNFQANRNGWILSRR